MPDPSNPGSGQSNAGSPETGGPASSRAGQRRRRGSSRPQRLIDTKGPAPDASVEDIRLTVGVIVGTHGVRGEMRMTLLTDTPEHLHEIERVYLGDLDTPVALEGVRFHGTGALVTIAGIDTPEAARELRGTPVRIDGRDAVPLEEGETFLYQLVGLRAKTPDGDDLGVVVDIIETGANDVLVIAPEGSRARRSPADEILIPHHRQYVHDVDPAGGTITVTKPVYSDEVGQS
jgi:16S rRNA processing protein RimM